MTDSVRCPACGSAVIASAAPPGDAKMPCPQCGAMVPLPPPPPSRRPASGKKGPPGKGAPRRKAQPPLLAAGNKGPEDLIDMTAMVDIVFFLLIFFLVTSMQALEAVMNLPPPQGESNAPASVQTTTPQENDADLIHVKIDDDDSYWVDDLQVFGETELRTALRVVRDEMGDPSGMMIVGSADASHGAAVAVFDAAAELGLSNVIFTVQDNDDAVAGS